MDIPVWGWVTFNLFVLVMLALDLGVFHRRAHVVTIREALTWSGVWVALAMAFNCLLYFWLGAEPALEFLAGYLIEKSLSIDNVFVFAVLFSAFAVPRECEHKVLFWGVFGALVMRAAMIFAGVALIARFHWLIYVFGAFLIVTGVKLLRASGETADPRNHFLVRLCRRWLPVTDQYDGANMFVRRDGKFWFTPLAIVLVLVETTDLIFAIDSIPAILAVSNESFIVFTSNVFAMLGLRSLYFALAGMLDKFRYLKFGLAGVLSFVGCKMLLVDIAPLPIAASLVVVAAIIGTSLAASLLVDARRRRADNSSPDLMTAGATGNAE